MESFDSKIFEEILNFNLTPRSTFSRARIELTQDAIKYMLVRKGYAFPEIVFNVEFNNDESSFVDIDFRVDPKAKSYVRRINIVGNTKTNDEVYRRESDNLNRLYMAKIKWKDQNKAPALKIC